MNTMEGEPQRRTASPATAGRKCKLSRNTRSVDQATIRRRNQNRLSQQQHRKNQHAYIRSLESFVETIKDSSGAEDRDGRYKRLLEAHTELIEENHRLQDMLHNMRRKLMNYVDELEATIGVTEGKVLEDSLITYHADNVSEDLNFATSVTDIDTIGGLTNQQDIITQPRFEDLARTNQPRQDLGVAPLDVNGGMVIPQGSSNLAGIAEERDWTRITHQFIANELIESKSRYHPIVYPQPDLFPLPGHNATLSSATVFADEILGAAKKLMLQWTCSAPSECGSASSGIAFDIAPAAVQVMGSLSGLETYIYPTRFSMYLEHVIRWRISRKPEDLVAVPEPFQPTPSQCYSENHPAVIDFINWPSIRDQLLRCAGSLDLDSVCRDVVLNSVLDLDLFDCSVNIHDLLFNHILPRVKGLQPINGNSSMLHMTSWTYLQLGPPGIGQFESSDEMSAEATLVKKIADRLLYEYNRQSELVTVLRPEVRQTPSSPFDECSLATLLSSFNVYEIKQWRLGRNFARKYPYIDCTSVISKYETVNCKTEAFRSKILESSYFSSKTISQLP